MEGVGSGGVEDLQKELESKRKTAPSGETVKDANESTLWKLSPLI